MADWTSLFTDVGKITGALLSGLLLSKEGSGGGSLMIGDVEISIHKVTDEPYVIYAKNQGKDPVNVSFSQCTLDKNGQTPATLLVPLYPGDSQVVGQEMATYQDGVITVNDALPMAGGDAPEATDRVVLAAIVGLSFGAIWAITGGFTIQVSQVNNANGGWTYTVSCTATQAFNFVRLIATGDNNQTASVELRAQPGSDGTWTAKGDFPSGTDFGSDYTTNLHQVQANIDMPAKTFDAIVAERQARTAVPVP